MTGLVKSAILAATLAVSAVPALAFTIQDGSAKGESSDYFSQEGRRFGSTGQQSGDEKASEGSNTLRFGNSTTMTFGNQRSFDADFQAGKERLLSPNQFNR